MIRVQKESKNIVNLSSIDKNRHEEVTRESLFENGESDDLDFRDDKTQGEGLSLDGESEGGVNLPAQTNSLNKLAKDVLEQLINNNLPPLPSNYQVYFERFLDEQDSGFRKKIYGLMEVENSRDDRAMDFEKSVNSGFSNTKEILTVISGIYKTLALINEKTSDFINSQGVLSSEAGRRFNDEINRLQQNANKQTERLKFLYQKGVKILGDINANTLYDSKFGVYNKRYFINQVIEETKMISKFEHNSTILMMSLSREVTRHLKDENTALIVMKTVAKLLLKTSRRSDLIGYIGNGIFGMLLKHSDISSSKKAAERLVDLLKNTSMFLGDIEINLHLSVGISKIQASKKPERALNSAINALRLAREAEIPYMVNKEDED